jgi:O-antigen ligase
MSNSAPSHFKIAFNQKILLFFMVLTYVCLVLTDISGFKFDIFALITIGTYCWVVMLCRMRFSVERISITLLLVAVYIGATSYMHQNSFNVLKYSVLFFIMLGCYMFFKLAFKDGYVYDRFNVYFILCQSFVALFGVLDYLLFDFGFVSPIRDYTISNQVDSFYSNPNPFGIICVLALVVLADNKGFSRYSSCILGITLLAGVVLSGSKMSLLMIFIWFFLRSFGFFKVLVCFVIGLFLLQAVSFDFALVLNKRIDIWLKAYAMWVEVPIFGLGTGNFQLSNESLDIYSNINDTHGLHSMFAWAIFEMGLLGFSIFMLFIILVLVDTKKTSISLYVLFILLLFSQITEFFIDHEEIFILFFMATVARISAISSLNKERLL